MLGADIAIIVAAGVIAAGVFGFLGKKIDNRLHSKERKGRDNASEIRVENRMMCVQCWTLCSPDRGDVLVGDAWWCRRCYKEMMK